MPEAANPAAAPAAVPSAALSAARATLFTVRIGTRVAAGFAVILAVLVGLGYAALTELRQEEAVTMQLHEHPFVVIRGLGDLRDALLQQYSSLRQAVLSDNTRAKNLADAARFGQAAEAAAKQVNAAYLGPRADIDAMLHALHPYLGAMRHAADLTAAGKTDEAATLLRGVGRDLRNTAHQATGKLLDFATDRAARFVHENQAAGDRTVLGAELTIAAALLFGIGIATAVTLGITRPLAALIGALRQMTGGVRQIAIPGRARADEVGDLARSIAALNDSLIAADQAAARQADERLAAEKEKAAAVMKLAEKIESETATALSQINRQADTMSETAHAMLQSARQTNGSAEAAASSAQEALSSVQTVASAAEELAVSVREISSQMTHSTTLVGQAVSAGVEARSTIEALNDTVLRIGTVADMIGEIAGKTNLLALNATIEAARAGDAGKGFAVVASEVKQLAAQTARSTAEIAQHLNDVRGATRASVDAVGRIEQMIAEVNGVAAAIAASVEEQGSATAEIARSIQQTAQAAQSVTDRISEVHAETARTDADAERVTGTASDLAGSVGELRRSLVRAAHG